MIIITAEIGLLRTNCYLVTDEESREAFLIDPADRADELACLIEKEDVKLKGILITHGHFDHVFAVTELAARYHVPIYCGEQEAELLANPILNESAAFRREVSVVADRLLKDGQKLQLGRTEFTVIATPGHTIGSCCYYVEKAGLLISGDTLFQESTGRTDFPTGSMSSIVRSIREKLFILPDETKVYPGHGDSTTIAYEKKYNPFVAE